MKLTIFSGLPAYVRMTILSQIRRLLSTPVFYYEDAEDIAQDLLLFYLKRFYQIPNPDEALVVHSIRQYATTLLRQRYESQDFLNSSLTDYDVNGEFSFVGNSETANFDKISITELLVGLNDKEKQILQMVYNGYSVNKISATMHIHKRVIRRLFEKLRKKLK